MKTVKISHFRTLSSEPVGGFDKTGMQSRIKPSAIWHCNKNGFGDGRAS